MHMLDTIGVQQFLSPKYTIGAQNFLHNSKFVCGYDNNRCAFKKWNLFQVPKTEKSHKFGGIELKKQRVVVIWAVATLELKCSSSQANGIKSNTGNILESGVELGSMNVLGFDEREFSGEEKEEELDEKEKLRRLRISKANKGNTPWNKGKKHSAETLKRIRERTRIAMQNPKVKMKLATLGHAQSKETREKIGVGVRAGWERRRERLKLQETCFYEWQNLIAEACRRGSTCDRELQWDSYKVLDKELEQEWLQSVEQRKETPRPKGNKRAPKSAEQRRKISEAISAKWADDAYRNRVCSALSKYYGTQVGVERKPIRRLGCEREPKAQPTKKKKTKDSTEKVNSSEKAHTKRKRNKPTFKDPLASSKLEMIKSIRAQRAGAELKKTEAFTQAKVLIREAERAAQALEANATRSPLAQASLLESRELIAQAIQSLNSIENGHIDIFSENSIYPSTDVEGNLNSGSQTDVEGNLNSGSQTDVGAVGVNGFGYSSLLDLSSINNGDEDLGTEAALDSTSKFHVNGLPRDVEEDDYIASGSSSSSSSDTGLSSPSEVEIDEEQFASSFTGEQLRDQLLRLNGHININELLRSRTEVGHSSEFEEEENHKPPCSKTTTGKKWVRGRLVEIAEESD